MSAEPTSPKNNLNTMLLTIVLAVLGFVGYQSYNNAIQVASLVAAQITRPEIDLKIAEVKTEQAHEEGQLVELQLRLATLELTVSHLELTKP